ncbi:MAG: phosphate butyryltransferase [Candidatus Coatesbacteria bacterium]|nr:phosphate butyryltransferase [Candidatus Coatesbacteria bacterium]
MLSTMERWMQRLADKAPMRAFEQVIGICDVYVSDAGRRRLVLACAEDAKLMQAVELARERGIILPILIGDKGAIEKAARSVGIDLKTYELIGAADYEAALEQSVELVMADKADILMRGAVPAVDFLKAVLARKSELGISGLVTQVSCLEIPEYHKLLLMSDAAVVIKPTIQEKKEIIENAISVANALGLRLPKVALMAAVEIVNPSMEAALDNAIVAKMGDRGQIRGAIIDGPLSLDVATFKAAAELKGVKGEVAGDADILIVNKIEEGNILYKSLIRFANAKTGSVLVGASKPMIITSRVEVQNNELHSIALAVLLDAFYNLGKQAAA